MIVLIHNMGNWAFTTVKTCCPVLTAFAHYVMIG